MCLALGLCLAKLKVGQREEVQMATIIAGEPANGFRDETSDRASAASRLWVPLGRLFYSLIFILSGIGHFSLPMIAYGQSLGVPAAGFWVPFFGVVAVLGGLMIALGFKARWGALLLIFFLIPVTIVAHNFWSLSDPSLAQMQRIHFLKNLSLLGGAIMFWFMGPGPVSIDEISEGRAPS